MWARDRMNRQPTESRGWLVVGGGGAHSTWLSKTHKHSPINMLFSGRTLIIIYCHCKFKFLNKINQKLPSLMAIMFLNVNYCQCIVWSINVLTSLWAQKLWVHASIVNLYYLYDSFWHKILIETAVPFYKWSIPKRPAGWQWYTHN